MTSMASPSNDAAYDYTEGASPGDIDDVVANHNQSRRPYESFYGEDGQGTMFSGPSHSINPSSVSRMSHIEAGRRSRDSWSQHRRLSHDSGASKGRPSRRDSRDSHSSHRSVASKDVEDRSDEESVFLTDEEADEGRGRRQRRTSISGRSTVLGNIAQLFGGRAPTPERSRRASVSHRSARSIPQSARTSRRTYSRGRSDHGAETDEEERWGYMSDEEDSENATDLADDRASIPASMEYDSDSQEPHSHSQVLPLLVSDPIFGGEARIDIDTPFALLEPPPPGPPSRQTIYIEDEDTTIRFIGYEPISWRDWTWKIGVILSFGILGLLGHWFPRIWLRWVAREKAFKDLRNGFVVIEVSAPSLMAVRILMICKSAYRDIALFPICVINYPYPISTALPPSMDEAGLTRPQLFSENGQNGINIDKDHLLNELLVLDYRYSRFALDPRDGLFWMIRFVPLRLVSRVGLINDRNWRDSSWSSIGSATSGLQQSTRQQRLTMLGPNLIDIEGKSTLGLLVDEVRLFL